MSEPRFDAWVAALDERYLAGLTVSEVARALRALSSCYVERRAKLPEGAALATAGKRAAFALFYAPIHFLVVRHIVRALNIEPSRFRRVQDLGCGTGAAGAAWALEADTTRVIGADRNPWAVAEANWTYRQLGVSGHAARQDLARVRIDMRPGSGIIAAYVVNELPASVRDTILERVLHAHARGACVLVVEPIARRDLPWVDAWSAAFVERGGRVDEWRFPASLPQRQRTLAKAAGLNVQELTARSLFLC